MYLEATDAEPGTEFNLLSPNLQTWGDPPYMVTFWYHVFGETPAKLEVFGWDGEKLTEEPIWTLPEETFDGKKETILYEMRWLLFILFYLFTF